MSFIILNAICKSVWFQRYFYTKLGKNFLLFATKVLKVHICLFKIEQRRTEKRTVCLFFPLLDSIIFSAHREQCIHQSLIHSQYILFSHYNSNSLSLAQCKSRNISISTLHLPCIPKSVNRIGEVESYSIQPNETCSSNENKWIF